MHENKSVLSLISSRIVNRLIEEHPEIDFSEQEEDSVYNHRGFLFAEV